MVLFYSYCTVTSVEVVFAYMLHTVSGTEEDSMPRAKQHKNRVVDYPTVCLSVSQSNVWYIPFGRWYFSFAYTHIDFVYWQHKKDTNILS